MAKSYLICKSIRFSTELPFLIPIQTELLEQEGESEIRLELHRENFHLGFDQYNSHHDYKHNKKGRVFGRDFNYYLEPKNFYTYHRKKDDLLYVQSNTEISLDYIRRLNESKHFLIEPVPIDFKKMYSLITEVGGAWIADLKKEYLKTAGFFGPNVHKSDEFKEAASEGNVSSVQLKFISPSNREEYYIAISKKGSIVLYDTLSTVEKEIELVNDIYTKLINPPL